MKFISIFLITSFLCSFSQAQIKPPKNYKLESVEDYQKYKEEAIKAMRWLMETPFPEGASKHKDLNGFVMSWINGSPELKLDMRLELMGKMIKKGYKYGPEMMLVYLSGMALSELEGKPLTSGQRQLVGVYAMLNSYQMIKQDYPFAFLTKMEKRQKRGRLAYWIEQKMY